MVYKTYSSESEKFIINNQNLKNTLNFINLINLSVKESWLWRAKLLTGQALPLSVIATIFGALPVTSYKTLAIAPFVIL